MSSTPTSFASSLDYDGSLRSILLRHTSNTSTDSSYSHLPKLSFHVPPHPRHAKPAREEEDKFTWSKGDGGPRMITYEVVSRQSTARKAFGKVLQTVGLSRFHSIGDRVDLVSIPASRRRRSKESDSGAKPKKSKPSSLYSKPFISDDLEIPPGVNPVDYRMKQVSRKLDWLYYQQAAAPPPRKQEPKLSFNEIVQRDVYDRRLCPPLVGRRCQKGYECGLCR
jgi:hypothetical protein